MTKRLPIPGYEGLYSADTDGYVWRDEITVELKSGIRIAPAKRLNPTKPDMTRGGYLRTRLTDADGATKAHSIHRLIAMAFHENPLDKRTVNHIDGNRLNNRPDNLEWATDQEQIIHAWANGLRSNKKKNVTSGDKEAMRLMFLKGASIADIARHFGRKRSVVQDNTRDLRVK